MQELEEAERYSIAGLFTLALHSAASQADAGGETWGYVGPPRAGPPASSARSQPLLRLNRVQLTTRSPSNAGRQRKAPLSQTHSAPVHQTHSGAVTLPRAVGC